MTQEPQHRPQRSDHMFHVVVRTSAAFQNKARHFGSVDLRQLRQSSTRAGEPDQERLCVPDIYVYRTRGKTPLLR
jgi:hypothetical protein